MSTESAADQAWSSVVTMFIAAVTASPNMSAVRGSSRDASPSRSVHVVAYDQQKRCEKKYQHAYRTKVRLTPIYSGMIFLNQALLETMVRCNPSNTSPPVSGKQDAPMS